MIDPEFKKLQENAGHAASLLSSMSNKSRLMILCTLLDKEMSVSAINKIVPLSQSALSQHLAALRKSGLVATRKEAQTVFYSIASESPAKIIGVLKSIYCPDDENAESSQALSKKAPATLDYN